jgi:hypothetical protein
MNLVNMIKLRDLMAEFGLGHIVMDDVFRFDYAPDAPDAKCGTAACFAGWCALTERGQGALGLPPLPETTPSEWIVCAPSQVMASAEEWLDLDKAESDRLFYKFPVGTFNATPEEVYAWAIARLDEIIATGDISDPNSSRNPVVRGVNFEGARNE